MPSFQQVHHFMNHYIFQALQWLFGKLQVKPLPRIRPRRLLPILPPLQRPPNPLATAQKVLSTPRESNNDQHERNNDIFFYEKVESLVEAAWVMRRGYVPTANLMGNTNNNKVCIPAMNQSTKCQPHIPANIHRSEHNKVSLPTRLFKPRLPKKATTQPIEVINEVFDQGTVSDLIDDLLPNWLRVAVINTQSQFG
jgi:hypothetical protein